MKSNCIQPVSAAWTYCAMLAIILGLSTSASADDATASQGDKATTGDQQQLFDRISLKEAWDITKGDPRILVGVIDSGFDFYHPDLRGQLVPGYYFAGGFHTEFYENVAHGTLVSSLIVAKDDAAGMVGLAPHCRAMTCSQGMLEHKLIQIQQDFFRENPKAKLADLHKKMAEHQAELETFGKQWINYQMLGAAKAIRYLVDHDAKVINISSGMEKSLVQSTEVWDEIEAAFAYAASNNVVIVLAAGNNSMKWEGYPGTPDSMIVAGASLLDDTRWEGEVEMLDTKIKQGSNYGDRLTVMAPVENLMTCRPHDSRFYTVKGSPMGPMKVPFAGPHAVLPNGATSSAAPIVSSLVALMLSVDQDLDAKSVVEIVKQGCDDIGDQGYDIYTGYGRVNFGKTLSLVKRQKRD